MKKIFTILLLFSSLILISQEVDSADADLGLNKLILNQEKIVIDFNKKIDIQQKKKEKNSQNLVSLKSLLNEVQLKSDSLEMDLENEKSFNINLRAFVRDTANPFIKRTNKKFSSQIVDNNKFASNIDLINKDLSTLQSEISTANLKSLDNTEQINSVSTDLLSKQKIGLILIFLVLILILTSYIVGDKKSKKIFESQIKDSQQIVDWLSSKSESSLDNSSTANPDHSFAKNVADQIIRITTNLDRMDNTIKGHKSLNASVRRLKQALVRNEYEIIELLNTKYNSGMNVEPSFILDESLQTGESKITRIIKPQINYKGKMIQMAQVEVSQND